LFCVVITIIHFTFSKAHSTSWFKLPQPQPPISWRCAF
jgi:hypothetical protein